MRQARVRFALSDEQRQFGAAIHELLADADVPAAARAWAGGEHAPGLAIWRELAKSGVTALAVPESCGGLGAHPVDLVVACEELGHHPVPGPVAESVAAVPQLLAALAGRAGHRFARPRLAGGARLRGPDRDAGQAAAAALRAGRGRGRADPAGRRRLGLARCAGAQAGVGGPGQAAVRGLARPGRWPPGRMPRPPSRTRPATARWPARRCCSAPGAACSRPPRAMRRPGSSSAGRSDRSRP